MSVDLAPLFVDMDLSAHHFVTFTPEDKATEVMERFVSGHTLATP